MDRNRVNGVSAVESSASKGAGVLELWNGSGQIVWDHPGVRGSRHPIGLFRSELGATLTGMVLRGQRQTREPAQRTGSEQLFCPLISLTSQLVPSQRPRSGPAPP